MFDFVFVWFGIQFKLKPFTDLRSALPDTPLVVLSSSLYEGVTLGNSRTDTLPDSRRNS